MASGKGIPMISANSQIFPRVYGVEMGSGNLGYKQAFY